MLVELLGTAWKVCTGHRPLCPKKRSALLFLFWFWDILSMSVPSRVNSDQFAEYLQKDKLLPSLEAIASQQFSPTYWQGQSQTDRWTHLPNPAVNVCPGNVAHFTSYQTIDTIVDSNLGKVIKIQNRLFSSLECGLRRGSSWWTTWQRKGGDQPLKSENFLW